MNDVLSKESLKRVHSTIAMNIRRQRKVRNMSQMRLAMEMGHKSVGLVSFAEAGINN
jgi:ribosome-binding protein aMBF1 (putative translation factor)